MKNENAGMLASDVYDAFVLVPLYLSMYYKQNLYIHGPVSKKLYKNVMNYLQRILCDFSDDLSRIEVHVEGFKEAEGEQYIIGAGISCGVDSLTTIYDRYVLESDPDYRINALFFFNVGWQGDYYDERSEKLFFERYELNKSAAYELGLPVYLVRTNFHAFAYAIYGNNYPGGHMGYFSVYSCVLGLGGAMKRYYMANGRSYEKIKAFSGEEHDKDLSGFADPYLVPLIRTERLEIVIYGCQYDRTQKVERIADWDIAKRHLNVCVCKADTVSSAHNCSKCNKCLMTLIALESLGKLEEYADLFDLDTYRRHSYRNKCYVVLHRKDSAHENDNYLFARQHGVKMPSPVTAHMYFFARKLYGFSKRAARKIRNIFRR